MRLSFLLIISFTFSCVATRASMDLKLEQIIASKKDSIDREHVTFDSEGVKLAGTVFLPQNYFAAVVIVHGSDQVPRMTKFANILARNSIAVLTYDKRGVGESEGIYAGPEVGTNNIDTSNLILLANDANAALEFLKRQVADVPVGLIGASQAGWIMPIAASQNDRVDFMVLFSSPLISTLEQLRFQFYTDGNKEFWDTHTEADARYHIFNDSDRYKFVDNDPKVVLDQLSIPGLWLFGEKDIQIPVKLCIDYLNEFKVRGKSFEYVLFPSLGHNTSFTDTNVPLDIAIQWIKGKSRLLHTIDE